MALAEIHITQHAIERFHLRVRPGLSTAAAEIELARMVAVGELVNDPPSWYADRQRRTAAAYLVVGDLVLPLEPVDGNPCALVAVTCIARGGISDAARARRNERRRRGAPRRRTISRSRMDPVVR
jgi:hypothetical protein